MNNSKVEYVYEDENGQEYTTGEHQLPNDGMEQHGVAAGEVQEVMIVDQNMEIHVSEGATSLAHDTNADRDPDCKRRGA